MIMAAAQNGWIDGDKATMESLIAFERAAPQGMSPRRRVTRVTADARDMCDA